MADEQPQPTPQEQPVHHSEQARHISHSYEEDLAHAMNATDATVVQEMLTEAHEREVETATEKKEQRERKWYAVVSLFFIFITFAVLAYGTWKYTHLTVPVVPIASVGVFEQVPPVDTHATDITSVLQTLTTSTTLKPNTPYLIPLVSDLQSQTLLSNDDFFAYIKAAPDEPFTTLFSTVRLGVMNNGTTITPFIVGSVTDPVVAAKEFLIAEPNLLTWFSLALNIDTTNLPQQIGTTFRQEYRYNLPIRSFSYVNQNGTTIPLFFYGFATPTTIVIATDPAVLKAVSDTVIAQQ
jgi:hypothetical protein